MLRKIAVGASAAVVVAWLAAAPAVATSPSAAPGAVSSDADLRGALSDFATARRNSAAPPPVGTPIPEEPSSPPDSSPPPGDSGPGGPGPGDSGPPPSAPHVDTAGPPAAPEFTPPPTAPPEAPAPPPTSPPAEPRRPAERVMPTDNAPTRLPQTAVDSRPLTVAGGGSLVAAGLAWIGGARRRRKPVGPPAV